MERLLTGGSWGTSPALGLGGASGPEEQPDCALITDDYKEQLSNETATPEGIGPSHMDSKSTALSTELRGQGTKSMT